MQIGIIGLGKMGANIALRLFKNGHEVVVYNRTKDKVKEMEKQGLKGAYSLKELVSRLNKPRVIWLMIPAGKPIDDIIESLVKLLAPEDIIIDGGNSFYKDSIIRAEKLKKYKINFLDVGTSGGIWGFKKGFCLMIGGEEKIYKYLEPIFKTLSEKDGYFYCGTHGAGHFVKMIHNGIEYGIMQAYGEGFELLESSNFKLNLEKIAKLWNNGSVIRSWLLELLERAFQKDHQLSSIKGYVEDSGEGRWTVQTAIESAVSVPSIALSLFTRFSSRKEDTFSDRVIAALRQEFGGHSVKKKDG